MGATFWNFHVKHADAGEVGAVITADAGNPFLISRAPEAGWLSVYPGSMPAARKLARLASTGLGVPSLFFEVYDSDACRIALYNDGKRVSQFANEWDEQEPEPGEANRFAKYATSRDAAAIRQILDAKPVFAEEIAIRFGECFGLPRERVVCGYDWFPAGGHPAWMLAVA